MKIAILVDQLVIGGVQKIAIEDARNLQKLGHKVQLLVLMRKGYNPKFKEFAKQVNIQFLSDRYPFPFNHSVKFPIFSFFSTLHVLSPFLAPFVIKRGQFDIILSHGTTTCFTAQSLKFTKGISYLAFIHDPMNYILKVAYINSPLRLLIPILKPILKYLEKGLVENASEVLLLSKLHQGFISKTYNAKTTVLPPAARIPKKIHNFKRDIILASTRWEPNKNPQLFLKVAKSIPEIKIVLAGSWSNRKELEKFRNDIKRKILTSQITVSTNVTEDELAKLYQKAIVFVHPIKEAFSMGGLEAAVNGCPIIIPSGSGITNHLKNKIDGIFLDNPTEQNFIKAVKKVISNPNYAQRMGFSARKKLMSFSWENHTKKILKIIEKSLSRKFLHIVALETGHASESYLSGGDKLLEKMARFMPPKFKISVIVPAIGAKHWYSANLKNVTIITLPKTVFDNNTKPLMIFLAYLIRIWHSYKKLRQIREKDIIYSSTNVLPDVAPAYLLKLTSTRIPWIARVHHLVTPPLKRPGSLPVNIVSSFMQVISNFMMKSKSTLTLALNNNLKNILVTKGFKKENLQILGAGIDIQTIKKQKPYSTKTFDAIFVGRLHPSKGIYDLVSIWKKVVRQIHNAHAIVVGGGNQEQEKKLISQIKKSKLENNLAIAGYVSEKNLLKTLKSSKIFIFTDYEAGFSLAIAEAMAAGLPVVGYNLEIFGSVYKKGFITAPLGNTQKFSEQILFLLKNNAQYQKIKLDAILESRKFSWQKVSAKFVQTVNNLG